MADSYEGRVVKRRVSPGSKSDREAVMLDTGTQSLVLRRFGGNAFADPVLDGLVGHRIRGTGDRTGQLLILREYVDLDSDTSG